MGFYEQPCGKKPCEIDPIYTVLCLLYQREAEHGGGGGGGDGGAPPQHHSCPSGRQGRQLVQYLVHAKINNNITVQTCG